MITETDKFICADDIVRPLYNKLLQDIELAHLSDFNVKFLFRKEPKEIKGKMNLGIASKFQERDKFLHKWDFLVILDLHFWKANPDSREALLFHELLHCGVDDKGKPAIVPHDLEEFEAVVRRYGYWKKDVKSFAEQLELFNQAAATAAVEA